MVEKGARAIVAEAEPEEVQAVARLVQTVVCRDAGAPVVPPPPPPAAGLVLEARRDGRLVGGLLLDREGDGARVSWWAVERPERLTGVGRALLERAEGWCESQGLSPLAVRAITSVPSAARLLWACGFRVVSFDAVDLGGRSIELLWFEKAAPRGAASRAG